MHRFWSRHIQPIVETLAPRHIIEVGAEFGWNTRHLLEYCRRTGARIDVVDPSPHPALHDVLAAFPAEHRYHGLKSLDILGQLDPAELVLLDGDHNWYTVFNELKLIFQRAAETGATPPVVLFHDVAWPYARRDMYYDPRGILDENRHPYAYRGILPGKSTLTDSGLNGHFANALHEGGPRNGVLTAVEDFKASAGLPLELIKLPFFNGLGILVPEARMNAALKAVIDGFFTGDAMLEIAAELERDGMAVRADLAAVQTRLAEKTEALDRARIMNREMQEHVRAQLADAQQEVAQAGEELEQARHEAGQARHETEQARQEAEQARQDVKRVEAMRLRMMLRRAPGVLWERLLRDLGITRRARQE